MRLHTRVLGLAFVAVALGSLWLDGAGRSVADDKVAKEVRKAIEDMADALAKGDAKTATKIMENIKKHDLLEPMSLFKPRDPKDGSGGLGMGPKPGAVEPDGIEKYLIQMGRKPMTAMQLAKVAPDLERAAYISAAIGELTEHKCPIDKKMGDKDPKDWAKLSKGMKEEALELAKAVKKQDTKLVQKHMQNLYSNCSGCHGIFRSE